MEMSKIQVFEDTLSIIIIGDQFVGKTSLMKRFTENSFNESTLGTVGIECYKTLYMISKEKFLIKIWDTCGQEQFRSLTANYFRNAEGVILAYDVTDESSFLSLKNWICLIKDNVRDDIPKVIIGNKVDSVKKVVTTKQARVFADSQKLNLFEVSAKTNLNIKEAFESLLKQILKVKDSKHKIRDSIRVSVKPNIESKCLC